MEYTKIDVTKELEKWYVFPDDLSGGHFSGFENRYDASQMRGAFAVGENVQFGGAALPSLRPGSEVVGSEVEASTPVKRAWVYETRNGDQFELKVYGTKLYAWLIGTSTDYFELLSGFTENLDWTFNNIGKTEDATAHCIFSNGVDGGYKFSGAYTTVDSTNYSAGAIRALAINVAGTGYIVGDIITVDAGNTDATYEVLEVGGSGEVVSLECTNPGSGYSVSVGDATTGGTGTGLTVDVDNIGTGYIKKTGDNTFAEDGFDDASLTVPSLNINGTNYTYAGIDGKFAIGIGADPTGEAAGSLVVQTPKEVSGITALQGSVGMAHDGRLHLRLDTKKSIWQYSKLDDPFDFTATPAGDGIGGSKEVEFGGPITAFGKLNKTILCFKKRIIKSLSFEANSTRVDVPVYKTVTSSDDKGTTLGAINQKSTISTPYGIVFITPDKRIVLLTGLTDNSEPEYLILSDPIQPIIDGASFDDASMICVDNILHLSFKSSSDVAANDTVLRGDMTKRTTDSNGTTIPIRWDAPYVGWNVSDWTSVYNSSTGKYDIHAHSSLNGSTYKIIEQKTDNGNGFGATIRTWSEHFGVPQFQKKISNAFVEIRMKENAKPLVTLLYDENGITGQTETQLDGTDQEHRFDNTVYNPIGATPFGSVKIGSQEADIEYDTYRFFIEVNPNVYFFNIALQISTDGEAQDFELVRFGYEIAEVSKEFNPVYLT